MGMGGTHTITLWQGRLKKESGNGVINQIEVEIMEQEA